MQVPKPFAKAIVRYPVRFFGSASQLGTEFTQLRIPRHAVLFHPDKARDDTQRATATAKIYDINRAYETLSDPQKRELYDTVGAEG